MQISPVDRFLTHFRQGEFEAAHQALEALGSDTVEYSYFGGAVLMELGKLGEAETLLRRSIALSEQSGLSEGQHRGRDVELVALRWETLGELQLDRAHYDEAIRCFETCLLIWPDRGPSHRGIAEAWLRWDDGAAEALPWAKLAVKEDRAAKAISQQMYDQNLSADLAILAWATAATSQDSAQVHSLVAEALSHMEGGSVPSRARVHFHAGMAYAILREASRSHEHLNQARLIDLHGRWGRAARSHQERPRRKTQPLQSI